MESDSNNPSHFPVEDEENEEEDENEVEFLGELSPWFSMSSPISTSNLAIEAFSPLNLGSPMASATNPTNPSYILVEDDENEEEEIVFEPSWFSSLGFTSPLPSASSPSLIIPGFAYPDLVEEEGQQQGDAILPYGQQVILPNVEQGEGSGVGDNGDFVLGTSLKRAGDSVEGPSQKRMTMTIVDGNGSDIASCPICMEPWSSEGPHRICSLLCGHLYGRQCIEKWVRRFKYNIGKCPQCNERCKLKDIIDIYAPQVVVADPALHKEVISLRAENEVLKSESKFKEHVLQEIAKINEKHANIEAEVKNLRDMMSTSMPTSQVPEATATPLQLETNSYASQADPSAEVPEATATPSQLETNSSASQADPSSGTLRITSRSAT
ncbi:uncharacterized protein LOC143854716 isoform X2 [Tasmannia lanceolata]|uniref:uncharacterized protein LOC143854716 isoform X2 n=1 Tax=Tasmannia lanceolata TaxID=3420 RepID=UPI0040635D0A